MKGLLNIDSHLFFNIVFFHIDIIRNSQRYSKLYTQHFKCICSKEDYSASHICILPNQLFIVFEQNENKFFCHSQNVKNKIDYALINEIHCVTIVSFHRLVQIDNILSSVFTTIRPIFFIQEKTGFVPSFYPRKDGEKNIF